MFDGVDNSQLSKSQIGTLGTEIKQNLIAEMPARFRRRNPTGEDVEGTVAMIQREIEYILRLKERAVANVSNQRTSQHSRGNGNKTKGMNKKQRNDNRYVSGHEEDDYDEHAATEEGDDDGGDEDTVMEDEEHPESSCDGDESAAQVDHDGASQMQHALEGAMEVVKDHIARAAHVDWDDPHAALLWAQVISDDMAAVIPQLRTATGIHDDEED